MDDSELCVVYSAEHGPEAHFLKQLLEAEGIKVDVVGEFLQNAVGQLPAGIPTAPQIVVFKRDEERARALIEEYEDRKAERRNSAKDWQCPKCGELVNAGFDICWNCESIP